ncbi:MAG TPA: DUF5106 domain-containing protein [Flavisolibacter sp.]|nr:DUF5106 domain-containing protein [Flavisolibacter sp.]
MKYFATALLFLLTGSAFAQQGYEIKVTLKPFRNQYIYLGHYYGKQLPIIDSVKLDDKSQAVFKGNKKLGGGIYLIGFPDRSRNFEILIDQNQRFSVVADTADLRTLRFENSAENTAFRSYQEFMGRNGKAIDSLYKLRSASDKKDSAAITAQIDAINTTVKNYRNGIMTKEPNSLLATLLKAMKEPEVPKNDPAAAKDSLFAYRYYKAHYWDGVNFFDDRLVRTPFFETRLDKYYEQLVYPSADSVIRELDYMLGYASASEEMQKFLLLKFVNRYLNQKYMWEDAVFVHLFEKYFSQKSYPWLNDKGKKIITDRAYSLMANIMGTPAADVELPDTAGKKVNLYGLQSAYTLVAIWDPRCGHCKEVVPKLDSAYHARWKGMGMTLFGLAKETEGSKKDWMSFIHDHKLSSWTHVYYSKQDDMARINAGIPSYSQLYDVQTFPTLYLLDKDKRIIAKKVTLEQIDEILAFRAKKNQ